jgi:hypothetical protein
MKDKRLCGPEGFCNSRLLRGEHLARCPHCQACENAFAFWSRVFPCVVALVLCACGEGFSSGAAGGMDRDAAVSREASGFDAAGVDEAPAPAACDLAPCITTPNDRFGLNCNGTHYALCCSSPDLNNRDGGACSAGQICYCGMCPTASYQADAGRCEL